MKQMKMSKQGIKMLEMLEGCKLRAYKDSVGIWTIGVGHVSKANHKGLVITQEEADELLRQDVEKFERCINQLVTIKLMQNEVDAIISFCFNTGCNAFRKSTLLKKLNAGDKIGAAKEFARWNKAGHRVLAGLTRRRKVEAEMFMS